MRVDFKTFLTENKKTEKTENVHHLVFDGHDSVAKLDNTMKKMHNYLLDGKQKNSLFLLPKTNVNSGNYTVENQRAFKTHMENARREYQKLNPETYDVIGHHSKDMKDYSLKTQGSLSADGYINHIGKEHKKNMRDNSSENLQKSHSKKIEEVLRNKEHFDKLFKIHDHIKKASGVLNKVMKKNLKEETQSAGDAVRGFGDVSGNPAVDEDPLQQYLTTNQLAKDKENGALIKLMKQSQRNVVGFKEFAPNSRDKSLEYYENDPNADPLLRDKIRNRGKDNNVTRG